MGYSLHIHRSEDWFDEAQQNPISYKDWETLAKSDKEFVIVGLGGDARVDFEITSFGWPAPEGETAAFHWSATGTIEIESRSDEFVPKAHSIAQALGGELQGDDGEFYLADGTSYHKDIPNDETAPAAPENRSFFSKLFKR